MERGNKNQFISRFLSAITLIILIMYAFFSLFPIMMGLINSLKTDGEMLNNIMSLPKNIQWQNYTNAFQKINFIKSFFNTLIIASVGVTGMVIFGSMAGYKLARSETKLSKIIYSLFVMSMLIPFHSIMISLTKIARVTHTQGSTIGLGSIYIGLGVPMAVFLYHGFVKSIPKELEEAAIMDGCTEFKVYLHVIFPLLKPITATVVILNLLWIWNDFLLPLLMLTDSDDYTLLLSINMLFGQYNNNDWTAILAGLILSMLPVVVLYIFLQKHIVKGISEGAIKG